MAANNIPTEVVLGTWRAFLSQALTGAGWGAALAGGYGALVAGVHFLGTGRWDRGPLFAAWAVLLGLALGLLIQCLLALTSFLLANRPSLPAFRSPPLLPKIARRMSVEVPNGRPRS